jgi:tRNA/rRNA methyltransferase
MLTYADRARLAVVLVGARNPSNIGAAARAMHDFGFTDLRIVNDYAAPFEAAQLEAKSAVASAHVMHAARRFSTVAEAIADCTLVAATTAVGDRELRTPVQTLQQAAPEVVGSLSSTGARVALLFGSEKTGLTREQLSHSSLLLTIPMFSPRAAEDSAATHEQGATAAATPRHLSMNLGQAVAVCLYELTRDGFAGAKELPVRNEPPATAADRERLTQLLLDALHATGYSRRFPANATEAQVRQLAQQMGASHREAMTWMGVLRQILWRERGEPGQ